MDTRTRQACFLVRNIDPLFSTFSRERPSLWFASMAIYDSCAHLLEPDECPAMASDISTYRANHWRNLFFGLLTETAVKALAFDLRARGLPMGPELEEFFTNFFLPR